MLLTSSNYRAAFLKKESVYRITCSLKRLHADQGAVSLPTEQAKVCLSACIVSLPALLSQGHCENERCIYSRLPCVTVAFVQWPLPVLKLAAVVCLQIGSLVFWTKIARGFFLFLTKEEQWPHCTQKSCLHDCWLPAWPFQSSFRKNRTLCISSSQL